MPTFVVHLIEQTVRVVRVSAEDPDQAIEQARDTPDESTYTESVGAEVYDADGVLLKSDELIDSEH